MTSALLKTGDAVLIECDGQRVPGSVAMASGNGLSLVLEFDALIDGHLGMMPVLRDDAGQYQALMTGRPVKLSLR